MSDPDFASLFAEYSEYDPPGEAPEFRPRPPATLDTPQVTTVKPRSPGVPAPATTPAAAPTAPLPRLSTQSPGADIKVPELGVAPVPLSIPAAPEPPAVAWPYRAAGGYYDAGTRVRTMRDI